MAALKYLSSDSHFLEPAELWVKRLDRKYRDDAPRIMKNPNTGSRSAYVFGGGGGLKSASVGATGAPGLEGEELKSKDTGPWQDFPGGFDPVVRIKDQDVDGVLAEVMYPTFGMFLFGMSDAAMQQACMLAYNDFAAEFCKHDLKRFLGIGLIPLHDIRAGVAEVERCAKLGLRGAMIWIVPPADKPYSSRVYDPVWQACAEAKLPVTLHGATNATGWNDPILRNDGEGMVETWATSFNEIQGTLGQFVFGGVLDRYPGLKVVSVENDVMWMRHFVYRADRAWEHYGAYSKARLSKKPSEYMRKQVFATFEREPIFEDEYRVFGMYNYMWASDYPHGVSTWPKSAAVIDKAFAGVSEEVRNRVIYQNVAELYGYK